MTGASLIGVGSALAFVLGLIALLTRALKGFAPGSSTGAAPELEVLARTALAPKQGVAAIRFAGRRALVSYGEGGVRLLLEDEAPEADRVDQTAPRSSVSESAFAGLLAEATGRTGSPLATASERPSASAPTSRRVRGAMNRMRRALRVTGMAVVLAFGPGLGTGEAVAQQASPPTAGALGGPVNAATSGAATAAPVAGSGQTTGQPADRAVEDLLASALTSMGLGGAPADQARPMLSGPVGTVIFLGFLTLLPTLLLLMTSFTRILVVLHLLKQAIGTQTAPPAHLLAAMALLLTGFVMGPTLSRVNSTALTPWMDGQIDEAAMLQQASLPFRDFMLESAREADLAAFVDMSGSEPETVDDIPLVVLTSAFVTSELTNAFKMGFALFLPFIIIDIVVASILMSMGMFMLPPVMVSLPFKLLLFVLVDGWSLVVGSLVQSFG